MSDQERSLSDEELEAVSGGTEMDARGGSLDSMSELSESTGLEMQVLMDRMAKANQSASTILKKASDTASSIINNMK
jgi:hypothetical protein